MAFDQNKPANNEALVSADVRNNFIHIKGAISKEHVWDDSNPGNTAHRLDLMKVVATASTQRDIAAGVDYTTGSGNIGTLINHTDQGITANTYSLQGILQELIDRSHRHRIEQRLSNCNCNCSDNCLILGTQITMANGSLKNIEAIQIGENVRGLSKNNKVLAVKFTTLGNNRSLMTLSPQQDIFFSSEHLFWIRQDGGEYFGTHDYNQYIRQSKFVHEVDGHDYHYGLTEKPFVITGQTEYAKSNGWQQSAAVIDRSATSEIRLCTLIVDGDHTFIANNYVVEGFAHDNDFNYKNVRWEGK